MLYVEDLRDIIASALSLADAEREFLIRYPAMRCLASIHRGMDLQTNVKELARIEVCLIWREDTAKCWTGTEALEGLCRRNGH